MARIKATYGPRKPLYNNIPPASFHRRGELREEEALRILQGFLYDWIRGLESRPYVYDTIQDLVAHDRHLSRLNEALNYALENSREAFEPNEPLPDSDPILRFARLIIRSIPEAAMKDDPQSSWPDLYLRWHSYREWARYYSAYLTFDQTEDVDLREARVPYLRRSLSSATAGGQLGKMHIIYSKRLQFGICKDTYHMVYEPSFLPATGDQSSGENNATDSPESERGCSTTPDPNTVDVSSSDTGCGRARYYYPGCLLDFVPWHGQGTIEVGATIVRSDIGDWYYQDPATRPTPSPAKLKDARNRRSLRFRKKFVWKPGWMEKAPSRQHLQRNLEDYRTWMEIGLVALQSGRWEYGYESREDRFARVNHLERRAEWGELERAARSTQVVPFGLGGMRSARRGGWRF